ncbi:MAG: hypothetical protein IJ620_02095 [Bacteroidales bacterium]|nr:hypothetical protein [Bacteroidales bacterium]
MTSECERAEVAFAGVCRYVAWCLLSWGGLLSVACRSKKEPASRYGKAGLFSIFRAGGHQLFTRSE